MQDRRLSRRSLRTISRRRPYNAALRGEDQALSDYADAVDSAWRAYQTALTSLDSTKKGTEDQLEAYSDTLASANAGANTAVTEESLRQLGKTLDDTKITAPVSGTVTAVYATVGSSGSGLLFVIEDTDHLVVSTSVKGYDLGNVKTGMTVEIKSDATATRSFPARSRRLRPRRRKTSWAIRRALPILPLRRRSPWTRRVPGFASAWRRA